MTKPEGDNPEQPDLGKAAKDFWTAAKAKAKELGGKAAETAKDVGAKAAKEAEDLRATSQQPQTTAEAGTKEPTNSASSLKDKALDVWRRAPTLVVASGLGVLLLCSSCCICGGFMSLFSGPKKSDDALFSRADAKPTGQSHGTAKVDANQSHGTAKFDAKNVENTFRLFESHLQEVVEAGKGGNSLAEDEKMKEASRYISSFVGREVEWEFQVRYVDQAVNAICRNHPIIQDNPVPLICVRAGKAATLDSCDFAIGKFVSREYATKLRKGDKIRVRGRIESYEKVDSFHIIKLGDAQVVE